MNTRELTFYPRIQSVLSSQYRNELLDAAQSIPVKGGRRLTTSVLNIYSFFVDVTLSSSGVAYSALDIRNDENKLNRHLSEFIGFLYSKHMDLSVQSRSLYGIHSIKIFSKFALHYNIKLKDIKLSAHKPTVDIVDCYGAFKSLNLNNELLIYYSGWCCQDKEGNQQNLYIATLYDCYGKAFTGRIHSVINDFTQTQKKTTMASCVFNLTLLFNEFTKHCKTTDELEFSLKAENSPALMENIYNSLLFQTMINGNDVKTFHIQWKTIVSHFTQCFIDTNEFEEPIKPFLLPECKEPVDSVHSISIGGKLSEREEDRWLVDIPLEIKDEEALQMIHDRLNRDLEHIFIVSYKIFNELKLRHKRNENYIETGKIKPIPRYGISRQSFPIGFQYLDNVVATFYHHGFGVDDIVNRANFFGVKGDGHELIKELNLPTTFTLNVLVSLLVLEHPKITPSWLQEWELFDKHGKQVGFKKVGNQWIAVSFKNRKGADIAQQEVILNDYSKSIVEFLIEHTCYARAALKKQGGNDWRYVMLTATLVNPKRPRNLGDVLMAPGAYHKSLVVDSYYNRSILIPYKVAAKPHSVVHRIISSVPNRVLTKSEARDLAAIVTPRSIRKARALQIYLKTRSLKAVSEALGHKQVDLNLLESYLPKPLINFFNQRWIRQFQNAIIYEALKESPYLFDALDFNESKLEEFLCNHGLRELPENLERAGSCALNEEKKFFIENINELVFIITTPLLQVLIAIQNVINSASENDVFKSVVEKWHQAAEFILSHFSLTGRATNYRRIDKEFMGLYEEAINNPLDVERFKENLLCR